MPALFSRGYRVPKFSWRTLKHIFWRKSAVSVFVLVFLWTLLITSKTLERISQGKGLRRETIAYLRQANTRLQIGFYQILSSRRQVPFEPQHVTLVYIDDETHWFTLWGDVPTDRGYLAKLIINASQNNRKAAVIALDVLLLTPTGHLAGTDKDARAGENRELLDAINFAANQGVRVVLPTFFIVRKDGQKMRLPNIFDDSQLPLRGLDGRCKHQACAVLGYVNGPEDRRRIPLKETMLDWRGDPKSIREVESFAFATVNAQEEKHETTRNYALVVDALEHDRALLGSFVQEQCSGPPGNLAGFDCIKVEKLAVGDPDAEESCQGRIVLIGGRWHDTQGFGALVDGHLSPVGEISGLAFHANYIESLFARAVAEEVSSSTAIAVDLIIGLIIYAAFESCKGRWRITVLILALLIAPVFAYLFLVTQNLYLDFLLPSELYFLHLLYEYVYGRFRDARQNIGVQTT
jgi:CHASE2 domain-containing sensor protein